MLYRGIRLYDQYNFIDSNSLAKRKQTIYRINSVLYREVTCSGLFTYVGLDRAQNDSQKMGVTTTDQAKFGPEV